MKKTVMGGLASLVLAGGLIVAPAAHADPFCTTVGGFGSCDENDYAPDGSHTHCDSGWAPFVGPIRNCYWVNTHPAPPAP